MSTEEKVLDVSETTKGSKRRSRSRRHSKRTRTNSGISNTENDATQSNEEVEEKEDKKDEQIKISPKNRGRGRKRKPVNDEKLESLEKDDLSPPKQRKDDDANVLQVWNLVCLFLLHFFLFLCCTGVHFLFLS